jgi:DNA (cytosine-5)-methyltransferase 1
MAYGATTAQIENPKFSIVHQWTTDYDQDTCETYLNNICKQEQNGAVCGDRRKLDIEKTLGGKGDIDALAFGFPCNDYSVVGEQKGLDGIFGPLYSYGIKALKIFQPKWFLAENVGGLQNANEGKAFLQILNEMRDAGYEVTPHLYKFEKYGIPQSRHRVIIVGIRNTENVIYRVPSTLPYADIDNSCRAVIERPPLAVDTPNNERTKQSETVVRRLEHIRPGENAFTADLPEDLRIKTATKISQIYKRLDPTKLAYTVTGSGGGSTHIYPWDEPRALTNRERARLQTFPDTYVFMAQKRVSAVK